MLQPCLQLLRPHDLQVQLAKILSRWDATPEERLAFLDWAMDVAAEAELMATESPARAAQALRSERDFAHGRIAEQLLRFSTIDLQLVSKRTFFEYLSGELEPRRQAA